MGITNFPKVTGEESIEDLRNLVGILIKEVEYLANGHIDSNNIREIAGYKVNNTDLKHRSGIVGMSGADQANGNAVRFWAGSSDPNSAPFRVQQDGTLYATDGNFTGNITGSTITGSLIRTGDIGTSRLELQTGGFRGVTSDGFLSGLVFNPTPTDIVDLFLYHRGTKLLEFYDDITKFTIRGTSSATGMTLGGFAAPTFAAGSWSFNSGSSLDLTNATVSGLTFSFSGTTSGGGTDGHTHTFSGFGTIS